MSVMLNWKRNLVAALVLSGAVAATFGASSLSKSGNEYAILPSLPRDQVLPHLSLGPTGGFLVAQDPMIDGNGLGLRARRINADLSLVSGTFSVNSITEGDQQNAEVAVLPGGGAAFAWQGSTGSGNRIYVRFLTAENVFRGPEILASTRASGHQSDPAIAALKDGTIVVVWAEWNRDGSMQGVYGQRFGGDGARVGQTFQVNTITYLNQRTPVIAALDNGGFVVAWVSDEFRGRGSEYIDIAARIFDAQANPLGPDFALNSTEEICANPVITAIPGGFRAAWSSRLITTPRFVRNEEIGEIPTEVVVLSPLQATEIWNVSTRAFDLQGAPSGPDMIVNNTRKGDQFSPRIVNFNGRQLILWISYGQDKSDEGIYGRTLNQAGQFEGAEFLVPTRTRLAQIFPIAASSGDRVLVAWSSFITASVGFDIVAQQFSVAADEALAKPATPFASSLSQDTIMVTWAEVASEEVDAYRVHVDGDTAPLESAAGMLTITRPEWTAGSAHTVRISYQLKDGRVSPLSDAVSVTTWGADENGDSIPDEWQRENWGKQTNWPHALADTDADGASNISEFRAGTDPTSSASVLKVEISVREQGRYLEWPTAAGSYYQLQVTSDLKNWTNIGAARFAPSGLDAVPAEGPGQIQYYRVIRMR